MPELPEVETICRELDLHLVLPRVVKDLQLRRKDLRFPFPKKLRENLAGHEIRSIRRRGKYLLFSLNTGTLVTHLGMSGSWRLVQSDLDSKIHDHVVVELVPSKDSTVEFLVFNDPRRFGYFDWLPHGEAEADNKFLKSLGPEPLTSDFNAMGLHQSLRNRTAAIKTLIMDARRVVGVGNIYASEALFLAKIRPARKGRSLTMSECERLTAGIKVVLQQAIDGGGSTIRDYRNANGGSGSYQDRHAVYDREGERCRVCGTKIRRTVQGGRATYFCPTCQS